MRAEDKMGTDASIIYYHGDADGIMSAAILMSCFPAIKYKLVKCKYGETKPNPEDYVRASVAILDFSFEPEQMESICKSASSVVWIDHHKTAKEKMPELWKDSKIFGTRALDKSACLLAWEYYHPDMIPPRAVIYANDYDLWMHKHAESKAFVEYFSEFLIDPSSAEVLGLMNDAIALNGMIFRMIEAGNVLLAAKNTRIKKAFENGFDATIQGYACRVVNSCTDISEIGEYIYTHGYPIAVIWHAKGSSISVSLRSNSLDVGEMAKQRGGGGHEHAAGYVAVEYVNQIKAWLKMLGG